METTHKWQFSSLWPSLIQLFVYLLKQSEVSADFIGNKFTVGDLLKGFLYSILHMFYLLSFSLNSIVAMGTIAMILGSEI